MRTTDPEVRDRERTGSSGIGIVVGILLVIIGLAAIARPVYATIASTIAFGWIFIFAGIAQFIYAFGSRGAGQFVWMLLSIFYFGAGIVVLTNILSGAIALTLILGITIFVQGVLQVLLAFDLRPVRNWGWVLFSGILGVILGILIWSEWPFNADWMLGLFIGITLLFNGIWMLILSSLPRAT
ncbi:HdeD family acid-resistance protein [Gloeocapsopsis sp. IPPAS B-1203]|uniref:HdeD family acid-resistance protein n=1 Tax=Gloeocapsopsis sp. IPPAS B-1203 TaxID=2049454 RepID=UPI000C17EA6E|nr:HdeD family acid-resistance protein [Gloeocapsopsis sp. IPPAS B-1203]PIG93561.1 hypothetical protein CSQ79_11640 [Gloeocapsopsis sp. IPPAS B-1203]